MKKILAIVMLVIFMFTFVSCKEEDTSSSVVSEVTSELEISEVTSETSEVASEAEAVSADAITSEAVSNAETSEEVSAIPSPQTSIGE